MLRAVAALIGILLVASQASGGRVAATSGRESGGDAERRAVATMTRALSVIREARVARGRASDPDADGGRSGIVGDEFSPLTTSLGEVEAKRTAAHPAFAAALVRYFAQAGLSRGDVVAVGASGSFPGFILATFAAAHALDLEPVAIYSIGASMYGANLPGFTFADMLEELRARDVLPYRFVAIAPGGARDTGRGVLFDEDGATLIEEARRTGLRVIGGRTLAENIQERLRVFDEVASGRPIRCFVNIGGASANYGDTAASLHLPNGLVRRVVRVPESPTRGLAFEYLARGIPVINLLHVRGLALANGVPWDTTAVADERLLLAPGARQWLDAHNCYVENGRWADRLPRALASGAPYLAIEQDVAWRPDPTAPGGGHSVVSHETTLTGAEPTLDAHFFDRVQPLLDRALADGASDRWPVVILHLDFKTHEPAHHRAVWDLLGRYERYLTTSGKVAEGQVVPALRAGPLLVLTEAGPGQEEAFHGRLAVGDTLRLFGTVPPPEMSDRLKKRAHTLAPSFFVRTGATAYRRWANFSWAAVEGGGPRKAGRWTPADARRLTDLVNHVHGLGLWIRFYTLNGHAPRDGQGWTASYNFGSRDAAQARWQAAVAAGVEFVATDQYEDMAAVLRSGSRPAGVSGASSRDAGRDAVAPRASGPR